MSTTHNGKSPLEAARKWCGENPDALPPGRYGVIDPADPRGAALLTDIANSRDETPTERLRAGYVRGDPTKDEAALALTPIALGANLFVEFSDGMDATVNAVESIPTEFRRNRIKMALIEAYGAGGRDAHAVRNALDRKYDTLRASPPAPAPAAPVCLTCGAQTLGADECTACRRARCDDNDAQAAAQEREDAEADLERFDTGAD